MRALKILDVFFIMAGGLFMNIGLIKKRVAELQKDNSTLLWLEGSMYEMVTNVNFINNKIAIKLQNGTTRLLNFEKYLMTTVGIQFWCQEKPGVLYRWDLASQTESLKECYQTTVPDDDPPPTPPYLVA